MARPNASVEALREARARRPKRVPTKNFRPGYRSRYGRMAEDVILEAKQHLVRAFADSLATLGKPDDRVRRSDAYRLERALRSRLDEVLMPLAARAYAIGLQKAQDALGRVSGKPDNRPAPGGYPGYGRVQERGGPAIAGSDWVEPLDEPGARHRTTLLVWLGLVKRRTQNFAGGVSDWIDDREELAGSDGLPPTAQDVARRKQQRVPTVNLRARTTGERPSYPQDRPTGLLQPGEGPGHGRPPLPGERQRRGDRQQAVFSVANVYGIRYSGVGQDHPVPHGEKPLSVHN